MTSQPSKIKAAAYGGLALGAASATPGLNFLNCACCSLVLLGGFLAAHLYLKDVPRVPGSPPPYGDVALVGLLAGVFGAFVSAVIAMPLMMLGMGAGMWGAIQEQLQSTTDLPEPLRELLATAGAGTFAAGMVLLQLVINLFVFGLFATVGALIGAAVLHRTPPPAATPPPPVMPPPPLPPPVA